MNHHNIFRRVLAPSLAAAVLVAPAAVAKPVDSETIAERAAILRGHGMEQRYQGRDLVPVEPTGHYRGSGAYRGPDITLTPAGAEKSTLAESHFRGADTTAQPRDEKWAPPQSVFRGADTTAPPSGTDEPKRYFRGADTTSSPEHPAPTISIVREVDDSGIAWEDAALGAGTAAGLMILLAGGGGALLLRRRPRPQMP
jgi:hypothetical protein